MDLMTAFRRYVKMVTDHTSVGFSTDLVVEINLGAICMNSYQFCLRPLLGDSNRLFGLYFVIVVFWGSAGISLGGVFPLRLTARSVKLANKKNIRAITECFG